MAFYQFGPLWDTQRDVSIDAPVCMLRGLFVQDFPPGEGYCVSLDEGKLDSVKGIRVAIQSSKDNPD